MKKIVSLLLLSSLNFCLAQMDDAAWQKAIDDPAASKLARPSVAQFKYQEQDRTLFIHFSTNTGTGKEYDLGGIPASSFNPKKLDNRTAQIVKGSKVEIRLHLRGKQAGEKLVIYPPSY